MNFENILVNKPWGEEYLLYQTEEIALWHLKIKEGCETSLHAHPNKKTGLIVVSGGIETSFLSDKFKLFPSDKIMIRQGVFHKSRAIVGDCEILEIETPNNKEDIVRLEDKYGRKGQPYEGIDKYSDITIPVLDRYSKIGRCYINKFLFQYSDDVNDMYKTYIVISGRIVSNNFTVCGPGDVLYKENLKLMLQKFDLGQPLEVLGLYHGF